MTSGVKLTILHCFNLSLKDMASRPTRATGKAINYAEIGRTGRRDRVKKITGKGKKVDSDMEEGQIVDSPLHVMADETGEFASDTFSTGVSSFNPGGRTAGL